MAVQATFNTLGNVSVSNAYLRIDVVYTKKFYLPNGTKQHKIIYDVKAFKDKATANAQGQEIPCPEIEHMKGTYDPTSIINTYTLAYNHLKVSPKISGAIDV